MNNIYWSNLVVDCFDLTKMKQVCEISLKRYIPRILTKSEYLEASVVQKTLSQAKHLVYVVVSNPEQRTPGQSKFMGMHADAFEADGFELSLMNTVDQSLMLSDMIQSSQFLRSNLLTQARIGWDMRDCKLNDASILSFFQNLAGHRKPDYIRFSAEQGLISALANKLCSIKTIMPYNAEKTEEAELHYKSISATDLIKLDKETPRE